MIVAKVFFDAGQISFPHKGAVNYGAFISASQANDRTPFFYFIAPVSLRPTPIVTCVPFEEGNAFWKCDLFDFSKYRPTDSSAGVDWDDLSARAMLPQHAQRLPQPPKWIEIILTKAQRYWSEFTSRSDASGLWEKFRALPLSEQDQLIGRRAKKAVQSLRKDLFICTRWPEWQKYADILGFPTWTEDCRENGVPITVEALKKRVRRLGLGTRREMLV